MLQAHAAQQMYCPAYPTGIQLQADEGLPPRSDAWVWHQMALQARGYDLSNVQLQGMRVTYQKGAFQHGPPPPPRHDTLALAVVSAVLSTVIVLQALGLWLAYSRSVLGLRT